MASDSFCSHFSFSGPSPLWDKCSSSSHARSQKKWCASSDLRKPSQDFGLNKLCDSAPGRAAAWRSRHMWRQRRWSSMYVPFHLQGSEVKAWAKLFYSIIALLGSFYKCMALWPCRPRFRLAKSSDFRLRQEGYIFSLFWQVGGRSLELSTHQGRGAHSLEIAEEESGIIVSIAART